MTATVAAAVQAVDVDEELLAFVEDEAEPVPVVVADVVVVVPVPPEMGVWFAGQVPVDAVE